MKVYDDCFTVAFQSGGLHLNLNADRYTRAPAAFAARLIACGIHMFFSVRGLRCGCKSTLPLRSSREHHLSNVSRAH